MSALPLDLASPVAHHTPGTLGDRFAFALCKLMRFGADTMFRKRYLHRAVVLETVAAVPGLVGAALQHLRSLRLMRGRRRDGQDADGGVRERAHAPDGIREPLPAEPCSSACSCWRCEACSSTSSSRSTLVSPAVAHRLVGYFEEEAVISYTRFLDEIDAGRLPNLPIPDFARDYWQLGDAARLRELVLAVRADEAQHRDVNHDYARLERIL